MGNTLNIAVDPAFNEILVLQDVTIRLTVSIAGINVFADTYTAFGAQRKFFPSIISFQQAFGGLMFIQIVVTTPGSPTPGGVFTTIAIGTDGPNYAFQVSPNSNFAISLSSQNPETITNGVNIIVFTTVLMAATSNAIINLNGNTSSVPLAEIINISAKLGDRLTITITINGLTLTTNTLTIAKPAVTLSGAFGIIANGLVLFQGDTAPTPTPVPVPIPIVKRNTIIRIKNRCNKRKVRKSK